MTKNQIEYAKLRETMRANRANEEITRTRDEASRRLGLDTLQETGRHNVQVELQARDNLAETYRNNVGQLAELQRSHLINEGILQNRLALERDIAEESKRHNMASEDIALLTSDISKLNAQVAAAAHTAAAGIAASASQYASDQNLLAKQLQIDLDKYGIDVSADLRSSELGEQRRSNQAREAETSRTNVANEALKGASLLESFRHNYVGELQNKTKLDADIRLRGEQNAISQQQADTQRKAVEANISLVPSQKFQNYTRGIDALSGATSQIVNIFKKKG